MALLHLTAFDEDDLAILSAAMQDALILTADLKYLKREHRFALIASRFVWEKAEDKRQQFERRRSGLHFEGVLSVKLHRVLQGTGDAMLSLLSVTFEKGDPPGGTILLNFSGGGMIRLGVEAIEAWLRDLGPAWTTEKMPSHER
jgi:Protein of unknown function (DUF2948)